MPSDRHTAGRDQRLDRSPDRQVSFRFPLALDQRLDALVDRAVSAGERTNRRELLSALVLAADVDGVALGELLRSYRLSVVGDAVLDAEAEGGTSNVVEFARHQPGPRTRR